MNCGLQFWGVYTGIFTWTSSLFFGLFVPIMHMRDNDVAELWAAIDTTRFLGAEVVHMHRLQIPPARWRGWWFRWREEVWIM